MATTKQREYRSYPRPVDTTPAARHGRDTETERELIRRPANATPRNLADWR